MNTLKLASVMLSVMILFSGCNSIQQDTQIQGETTSDTTVTLTTTTTDVPKIDTTVITSETFTDTSLVTTLVTSITDSTSESFETSQDTTQLDTTTTTQVSSESDSTQEVTSIEAVDGIYNYDDLVIPVKSSSDYITQKMCDEVAQYFNSMVELDIDTFKSKQITAYNTFMEQYLEENGSSLQEMLSTYNDNFLHSNGNQDVVYSNVQFDSIRLDYPNDFDNIMNTMEYINQLDEITQEYEQYKLSEKLTAYYQLNYTIDYTLTDDSQQDYISSKNGSVLVLDINGDISLVMLY